MHLFERKNKNTEIKRLELSWSKLSHVTRKPHELSLSEQEKIRTDLCSLPFSAASDGLMVTALDQHQVPDVGQGWMYGWLTGRGFGSVCSSLSGLRVLPILLPVFCLRMAENRAADKV